MIFCMCYLCKFDVIKCKKWVWDKLIKLMNTTNDVGWKLELTQSIYVICITCHVIADQNSTFDPWQLCDIIKYTQE